MGAHRPVCAARRDPSRCGRNHAAAQRRWAINLSSRYCPQCLAGDESPVQNQLGGPWKLPRHLPVVFACTTHALPLSGSCPLCSNLPYRPPGTERSGLLMQRAASGLHPGHAGSSLRGARGGGRRSIAARSPASSVTARHPRAGDLPAGPPWWRQRRPPVHGRRVAGPVPGALARERPPTRRLAPLRAGAPLGPPDRGVRPPPVPALPSPTPPVRLGVHGTRPDRPVPPRPRRRQGEGGKGAKRPAHQQQPRRAGRSAQGQIPSSSGRTRYADGSLGSDATHGEPRAHRYRR
ncbi:TniQ family protein [Streptomyces sp. NPDC006365]|uniref:TniQ family protein n=1 Tax=Streptomyces sp. NPDC006365 TaxID=3364744 RepID=UPI0036D0D064